MSDRALTLIEVLLSVTLMAVVMVTISGMSIQQVRTATAIEQHSERMQSLAMILSLLRDDLTQALPSPQLGDTGPHHIKIRTFHRAAGDQGHGPWIVSWAWDAQTRRLTRQGDGAELRVLIGDVRELEFIEDQQKKIMRVAFLQGNPIDLVICGLRP